MDSPAYQIAQRLGDNAEAVCRHYLSNGRREGHYWLVGDIGNAPGRSLYVRLSASGDGAAAGKWTDAATGEHGDLLDIIAASCGHAALRETLAEARRFLGGSMPAQLAAKPRLPRAPTGTPEAARRLWAGSKPLAGSAAERYLAGRGIEDAAGLTALRYHPRCYYRAGPDDAPGVRDAWPALIAAVTDEAGEICGVHRTWLDPGTGEKAEVAHPRRAMGHLLGNGVRFGRAGPVMAAGEGIETILSLRQAMPAMPMIAALSAAHLAAVGFPPGLRRLYVARENDAAGTSAFASLAERGIPAGVAVIPLESRLADFNDDLRSFGMVLSLSRISRQLEISDRVRFLAE